MGSRFSLGSDRDGRANRHQPSDLLNLLVRDGDTSVGPIVQAVRRDGSGTSPSSGW